MIDDALAMDASLSHYQTLDCSYRTNADLLCDTSLIDHIASIDASRNPPHASNRPLTANSQRLSLFYQNVRGLRSKSKEFFLATSAANFDIIALTETWLTDGHNSSEYFPSNYHLVMLLFTVATFLQ